MGAVLRPAAWRAAEKKKAEGDLGRQANQSQKQNATIPLAVLEAAWAGLCALYAAEAAGKRGMAALHRARLNQLVRAQLHQTAGDASARDRIPGGGRA